MQDIEVQLPSEALDQEIRKIPGQGSGISLQLSLPKTPSPPLSVTSLAAFVEFYLLEQQLRAIRGAGETLTRLASGFNGGRAERMRQFKESGDNETGVIAFVPQMSRNEVQIKLSRAQHAG